MKSLRVPCSAMSITDKMVSLMPGYRNIFCRQGLEISISLKRKFEEGILVKWNKHMREIFIRWAIADTAFIALSLSGF